VRREGARGDAVRQGGELGLGTTHGVVCGTRGRVEEEGGEVRSRGRAKEGGIVWLCVLGRLGRCEFIFGSKILGKNVDFKSIPIFIPKLWDKNYSFLKVGKLKAD
jgi:hypothetical protein